MFKFVTKVRSWFRIEISPWYCLNIYFSSKMENISYIGNIWSFQPQRDFCNIYSSLECLFWNLSFTYLCFLYFAPKCILYFASKCILYFVSKCIVWLNNGLLTSEGMCICGVTSEWPKNKKRCRKEDNERGWLRFSQVRHFLLFFAL